MRYVRSATPPIILTAPLGNIIRCASCINFLHKCFLVLASEPTVLGGYPTPPAGDEARPPHPLRKAISVCIEGCWFVPINPRKSKVCIRSSHLWERARVQIASQWVGSSDGFITELVSQFRRETIPV